MNSKTNIGQPLSNKTKNVYKIPDDYSTLQSMSEIRKCVEKISSLQKVLRESSSCSKSSFDQIDKSISISTSIDFLTSTVSKDMQPSHTTQTDYDGKYFLNILRKEQDRLLQMADKLEDDILILSKDENKYEDTLGILRSASGKAKLLVSQKMKQFEGLCHKNLHQETSDKFPTTNEDLQGFWDMITLQIKHVDSLFSDIAKMKNNNWQQIEDINHKQVKPKKKKNSTKISTNTVMNKASLKVENEVNPTKNHDFRRKELLELKRKAKYSMQNQESDQIKDNQKVEFFF